MRLDGIGIVDRPKLTKILQAIDSENLPAMYGALRDADESLRHSFVRYLALNNVRGGRLALTKLQNTTDPMAAIRAGAICLLAMKVAGN